MAHPGFALTLLAVLIVGSIVLLFTVGFITFALTVGPVILIGWFAWVVFALIIGRPKADA